MPQRFSATNYHHLSPPVLQRRSRDVPQSGRAEAEASMTFHVNTARLSRAEDEWQVERRDLEVRGGQLEAGEFGMGSPEDEPERASVEGPRQWVRLEGVF